MSGVLAEPSVGRLDKELAPDFLAFKTDDAARPDEQAARRFAIAVLTELESREKVELPDMAFVRIPGGFKIERKTNASR